MRESSPPERETLRQKAAYWAYRGVERLATTLPERVGRRVFTGAGRLAFRRLEGVRETVAANQALVLGLEPDDPRVRLSTLEAFELYGRYWLDTFRLRTMTREELDARTDMIGVENIDAALDAGRGCICVLPHMGNWDAAGHWLAEHGYRIAAVAEELRPARLSKLFLSHREQLGMRIIPLTRNGHVGQQLKLLLAENWIVALVADRDLTGRGVEVEMFGRARRIPAGPALLSLTTQAPLLVCPVFTRDLGWTVSIGEPLRIERSGVMRKDVEALSSLMAEAFERSIAAKPPDWHMFQPAWGDRAIVAVP